MIGLPLAWTLLSVSLWTAGSSQILLSTETLSIIYPKIHSPETIECECVNISCDSVYWFHSVPNQQNVRFLGKCNNADRVNYGAHFNQARFKLSKRGTTSFVLRITNVTQEDAGIYSCVLKDKSNKEMWKPGVLLRPGETPPTLPPVTKTKPRVKHLCPCKKDPTHTGCAPLVLWPLVGLTVALALAVMCTLHYFSHLPKKCRHHFAKRVAKATSTGP